MSKINKLKKEVIKLALYRLENSEDANQYITHNGIEVYLSSEVIIKAFQKKEIDFGDAFSYFSIKNKKVKITFCHAGIEIESSTSTELNHSDIIDVPEVLEKAIEAFSKDEVVNNESNTRTK